MNSDNLCFDTNTLISYLFFVEPKYSIIQKFINLSEDKFFITKHIINECDVVVESKIQVFKLLMKDMILFLDDYQDELFTQTKFCGMFLNNNHKYFYRNKVVKDKEIMQMINKVWIKYCTENMEGFTLLDIINRLNLSINYIVNENKDELYSKFFLIDNHINKHDDILDVLIKNNSHRADNEIILDLYEYYINHKIKFGLITFDRQFYNSLKASNFSFIQKIYNSSDLERLISN